MNLVENKGRADNFQLHLLISKSPVNEKLVGRRETDDSKVNIGNERLALLRGREPERGHYFLLLSILLSIVASGKERVSCVRQIFILRISANLEKRLLVFTRVREKSREIARVVVVIEVVNQLSDNVNLNLLEKRASEKVASGKVIPIEVSKHETMFI